MTGSVEAVINSLKGMINRNGPHYLSDKPYQVYEELKESGITDRKTAGAILLFLVNGMMDELDRDIDFDSLCKEIQKECCFNKKMAEKLTSIFLSLYSIANKEEWKNRELEGLSQFLKKDFTCIWNGFSVWQTEGGSVDCHYKAEMILRPTEPDCIGKKLLDPLKKNPFMTKEAITDFYEHEIQDYLDDEFERYCTCEDYYQPVVEDFEFDYYLAEWCRKNGFEIVSYEGDGHDDGYEPSFTRHFYY